MELKALMERVLGTEEGSTGLTMYLVGNPAPTAYVVKEDGAQDTHRVMIGAIQRCSCGGGCRDVGEGVGAFSASTVSSSAFDTSTRRGTVGRARRVAGSNETASSSSSAVVVNDGDRQLAVTEGAFATELALHQARRVTAVDDNQWNTAISSEAATPRLVAAATAMGVAAGVNENNVAPAQATEITLTRLGDGVDILPSSDGDTSALNSDHPTAPASIGNSSNNSKGSGSELCVHLLWVMLKVLRAPATHPTVWQLSLTDTELDQLLAFREARQLVTKHKHRFLRRRTGATAAARRGIYGRARDDGDIRDGDGREDGDFAVTGGGCVSGENWDGPDNAAQQPLSDNPDDESCPICLDPMSAASDGGSLAVTYCRPACGQNVHVKCMLEYAEHDAKTRGGFSNYDGPKCLLCRTSWGENALPWLRRYWERQQRVVIAAASHVANPNPRDGQRGSECHTASRCDACNVKPIRGQRYCCILCGPWWSSAVHAPSSSSTSKKVELCEGCFGHGRHAKHAFVVKDRVGDAWRPAPRFSASFQHGSRSSSSTSTSSQLWRPVAPMVNDNGTVVLTPDALIALQHRELSPNDYNMLLLLDQQQQLFQGEEQSRGRGGVGTRRRVQVSGSVETPADRGVPGNLGSYLAEMLPVATVQDEHVSCAHCGRMLAQSPPDHAITAAVANSNRGDGDAAGVARDRQHHRKYPCGHTVHFACALLAASPPDATIIQTGESTQPPPAPSLPSMTPGADASATSSTPTRFACPISHCGVPTFPGLYRRSRPRLATAMPVAESVAMTTAGNLTGSAADLVVGSSSINIGGSETTAIAQEERSSRHGTAAFGSTVFRDGSNNNNGKQQSAKAVREALLATEAARLEVNLAEKMQRIKQQQDQQKQQKKGKKRRQFSNGRPTSAQESGSGDTSGITLDGTSCGSGAMLNSNSATGIAVVSEGRHLVRSSVLPRRNERLNAVPNELSRDEGLSGRPLFALSAPRSKAPCAGYEGGGGGASHRRKH